MKPIPYFDAHCDTIYRCMMTGGEVTLDFGEDAEEQKRFFAKCGCLRENEGHIDLMRGRRFARFGQFFALFFDAADAPEDGMWAQCRRLHDCFVQEMETNADLICHCRTGAEIDRAVKNGKMAALLSMEGADLIECDVHKLQTAADWGVRFLNPVWNRANALSGTNSQERERGLSDKGRDFIRQMERCGIYADVSHLSDRGFWDLCRMTARPIVASHSNSRALCDHPRNLTDDQFRAIRDTGGVVGMNFYSHFIGKQPSVDDLVRHIEHFLAMDGEKTVCMGGDLDGCEELPQGMQGMEDVPKIWQALEERGYPRPLLEDLFWNNLRKLL